MPRKGVQDPALSIDFWNSGWYSYRNPLFAPYRNIGITVATFHDSVIIGANMEDQDTLQWSRRPGFSIFCTQPLENETINQFYDSRNFYGTVTAYFDSSIRLADFNRTTITTLIPKTTVDQGYITAIGNLTYFSDGASVDMQKWDSATAFPTAINPSSWGLPAPTLTPTIYNRGCWLPLSQFMVNNAILDPNGNVEVVTSVFGPAGISGVNQPLWPTTPVSTINDGSIQWTNMGPLEIWLPDQNYPVPVVVLDTNGNLQLATTTNAVVVDWNAGDTYNIGDTVFFAGNYWTSLVAGNVGVAPSSAFSVTTGGTTQPYWVLAQNPITTGSTAPMPWNTAVGSQTVDNDYTWTNLGPGALIESFGTSYVYCFRTIYGHLSTASPISINTGSIFGPQVATISSYSIQNGLVTFVGTNNFVPGNVFTVTGFTVGMYLNNVPFIVSPIGLSATQFSAAFPYPTVPSTVDSGTTLNLVAAITGQGTTSPLCNATSNITATEVVADVVTIYSVNDFVPGLQVTFSGLTVATFLNNQQFQIINVDPDGLWFQVYFVTPNQTQTTDTGLVTFNAVEVYRTSDGGGIYLFAGAITNPIPSIVPIQPYDSGDVTAGIGQDSGTPGVHVWTNPNNVTSTSLYASIAVPTPGGGGGGSRFSVLQTCKAIFSGPVSSGIQDAFSLAVTAGNSILVFVNTFQITSWKVTDTQGNVYNQIAQYTDSNQSYVTVYLASGVAAGATTVKLNVSGVGSLAWFGFGALECAGLSGVVETPAYNFQTRGTTFITGVINTSAPNAVAFTAIWSDLFSGAASTPPDAYTLAINQVVTDSAETQQPVQQQAVAWQLQTATGVVEPEWSTPSGLKALGATVVLDLALYTPGDALNVFDFGFGIPPTVQITGIEIDLEAYFTGSLSYGSYEVQLLKAGSPFGVPMVINPTNANVNYMLGGANNLWGGSWIYSDFNSENFGVQITPVQLTGGTDATFYVRNVRARLTGSLNTAIWVYNDFTTDANLNELLIAPQNHLNDPPPGAPGSSINAVGTITAYWQGRIWMVVGNYVYFDAGPDCTNGVPEEAWPPANRFQFVGPVLALERTADGVGLLVYLADRVNAILGGPETISFYATDALSNFGISSPNCIFRDGSIIGQFTTQKQYFELLGGQKQEIGEHIADYLAANFDPTKSYVAMHRNGTDVGVFISNGVDQVIRYGSNIGAWSVPGFPVGGAGAMNSIETSVGTYSLMLAQKGGGSGPTPPPSTLPVGIQNTMVTLTSAQIKNAAVTPVVLIPAPTCPNRAIVPISCVAQLNFNTAAYTMDPDVTIGFGTSADDISNSGWMMFLTPAQSRGVILMTSASTQIAFASVTTSGQAAGAFDASTHLVNQPLYWINQTDISSDPGDSTVTLNIQWVEVDVTTGKIINGTGNCVYGSMTTLSSADLESTSVFQLVPAPSGNQLILPISLVMWSHFNTTINPNSACVGWGTTWDEVGAVFSNAFSVQPFYSGDTEDNFAMLSLGGVVDGAITPNLGGQPVDPATYKGQPISYANNQTPQYSPPASGGDSTVTIYVQYVILDTSTGLLVSSPSAGDLIPSFATLSSAQIDAAYVTPVTIAPAPGANLLNLPISYVATSAYNNVPYSDPGSAFSNSVFHFYPITGINLTGGAGSNYFVVAGDQTANFTTTFTRELSNTPDKNHVYHVVSATFVGGSTQIVVTDAIPGPYENSGGVPLPVIGPGSTSLLVGQTIDYMLFNAKTPMFTEEYNQILVGTPQTIITSDDGSGMIVSELVNQPIVWADAHNLAGNTADSTGAAMAQYLIVDMITGKVTSQSSAYSGCGAPPPPPNNNYLLARDLTTWQDQGHSNMSDGHNYPECYITVGSITLSQPGGSMFSLQHIVGYFDAVGTLHNGGSSYPDVWILPNEVSDTKGIGFVYLPEIVQEPPIGQNQPSTSLLALRWNVSMMNSSLASQYVHHLQVKIQFEPENAPNTIKALSFGADQNT